MLHVLEGSWEGSLSINRCGITCAKGRVFRQDLERLGREGGTGQGSHVNLS